MIRTLYENSKVALSYAVSWTLVLINQILKLPAKDMEFSHTAFGFYLQAVVGILTAVSLFVAIVYTLLKIKGFKERK